MIYTTIIPTRKNRALFLFLGICLSFAGLFFFTQNAIFLSSAQNSIGAVIDIDNNCSNSTKPMSTYTIEFKDKDDILREFTTSCSSIYSYEIGDKIDVVYRENDPSFAKINVIYDIFMFSAVLLFVGIGLSLNALYFYIRN
ncbi:MAG TPA: hypothetical protein DDX54_03110 [Rhodospirillaceae bacterium]|jgi:hypothetical protein|nr:DUF3592 domain-containing protein [Alphaproteobacteria bacterium]HBH26373.1 hypothetical protein [Rhodospirillaceae bacterium]